MLRFSILLIFSLAVFASQDIPIPSKPDGFSIGSDTPNLHLEAFYDLLCPDSRKSFEDLIPILDTEYHIFYNETLRFTVHIFPLPFHRNSFLAAQGARIIADNLYHDDDVWNYIGWILETQSALSNQVTANLTQLQAQEILTTLTVEAMPAYSGIFAKGLEYGNQYDTEARISWKYGCSRGITGTPTYMANGVVINGAGSFTAAQWRNFLNGGYVNYIYL